MDFDVQGGALSQDRNRFRNGENVERLVGHPLPTRPIRTFLALSVDTPTPTPAGAAVFLIRSPFSTPLSDHPPNLSPLGTGKHGATPPCVSLPVQNPGPHPAPSKTNRFCFTEETALPSQRCQPDRQMWTLSPGISLSDAGHVFTALGQPNARQEDPSACPQRATNLIREPQSPLPLWRYPQSEGSS